MDVFLLTPGGDTDHDPSSPTNDRDSSLSKRSALVADTSVHMVLLCNRGSVMGVCTLVVASGPKGYEPLVSIIFFWGKVENLGCRGVTDGT